MEKTFDMECTNAGKPTKEKLRRYLFTFTSFTETDDGHKIYGKNKFVLEGEGPRDHFLDDVISVKISFNEKED